MMNFPRQTTRLGRGLLFLLAIYVLYCICTMKYNMNYLRRFSWKISEDQRSDQKDGYLVWSPNCQIAEMDPFDITIKKFHRPVDKIVCSRFAPLTYTKRVAGEHFLKVDEGVVSQYLAIPKRLQCCLSVVTRLSENKSKVSLCVDFTNQAKVNASDEYLVVRCRDSKTGRKVYNNMHAVVQDKATPPLTTPPSATGAHSPLSVLLIGIDSMSRLNMFRTMPRTVEHLEHNDWLEMRGYNKIGDNTFPNLMAVLTGYSTEQLKSNGCFRPGKTFDRCRFIWKQFKKRGYVTAYAEDETDMGTFNYHKGGFLNAPTDHYFRPFMLAATKQLPTMTRDSFKVCLGPTSTSEHYLRFTIDMVNTYKTSPFFALIWLNNFSHNNYNTPATMDNRFVQFFQELQASGALNSTMVVFFSDHGARFGEIRNTYIGWLEERLPFFYTSVPSWFKSSYPEHYKNLKENCHRLSSPYDLHLTLKDIVEGLVQVDSASRNGSRGCTTCVSLFTPIPHDRGCLDAGITPHWCACGAQAKKPISDEFIKNATTFVIDEIWTKLSLAGNESQNCAKLQLRTILDARVKVVHEVSRSFDDYIVVFATKPAGQFDATVRYWQVHWFPHFELLGNVSRIDSYQAHSECIKNAELKLYCICNN